MHSILVDARGFLGVGSGDAYDYHRATQGAAGLPDFAVRYWDDQPIRGLFEKDNRLRAAELIQSRIHFIVFARERDYRDGELPQVTYACPNPAGYSRMQTQPALHITHSQLRPMR
jgi:hypothetical protein